MTASVIPPVWKVQPDRRSERPRVSFPWPHRLCLKWPPTLYHLRSPTAQSKLTELHLPCRSSGRAIFLSSAAAQSTHLSRPSYRPLVPSEGRPSLCQETCQGHQPASNKAWACRACRCKSRRLQATDLELYRRLA